MLSIWGTISWLISWTLSWTISWTILRTISWTILMRIWVLISCTWTRWTACRQFWHRDDFVYNFVDNYSDNFEDNSMCNILKNLNFINLLPGQGGLLVVHFDIGTILPSMEPLLHWDTLWKRRNIIIKSKKKNLIIKTIVKYEIDTLKVS